MTIRATTNTEQGLSHRAWYLPGLDLLEIRAARATLVPWHRHGRPCLVVVLTNGYTQITDGRRFTCRSGELALVPATRRHREEITAGTWGLLAYPKVEAVGFEGSRREDAVTATLDRWAHVGERRGAPIAELRRELNAPDAATPLVLESRLLETIAALVRERQRSIGRPPSWLEGVRARTLEEFDQPLTVAGLATEVGVAPHRLARLYRRVYRRSIGEVVRARRLERARELLATTDRPIAHIALDVGFCDQSHLNRQFRRHFGETPLGHRRRMVPRGRG